MKRVAIVQARMGSERLPGKVLMPLGGKPMLAQQLARMRRAETLDAITIATTTHPRDDKVAALAAAERVPCFRGSEDDVLARYAGAARAFVAEVIVRITADCPLIDAGVIDRVVRALGDADYASNVQRRTYPRGLDVEVFTRATLDRVEREATSAKAREHVTYFIHSERPELFRRHSVEDGADHSALRWTVDTPADFALIEALYARGAATLDYPGLLALIDREPALARINAHVEQKK
ncbi:MAG: glycosyltransferase family protein [Deltaproteobacteria bacterium]|nr:glycosyltransferase family protein [Deltaproteobacteria bacterium]